jgi:hypothetical protein
MKLRFLILFSLLIPSISFCESEVIRNKILIADVSGNVYNANKLIFPTNSLTNNGDGSFTVAGFDTAANYTLSGTWYHYGYNTFAAGFTAGADSYISAKFGIATDVPTHSLTLGSTATGLTFYNTTDQTTNYERTITQYTSNEFRITSTSGGTGTTRPLRFVSGFSTYYVHPTGGGFNNFHTWNITSTSINPSAGMFGALSVLGQTSGTTKNFRIAPTINQSSTAGYIAFQIDVTSTTVGSGSKTLLDASVDSVSRFSIDSFGKVTSSATITAAGTTGARTINTPKGVVNFAAAATSLVVTNSLVSTSSFIDCTVRTNDTTMKAAACVPGSGSFTIYPNAAPTAETAVGFTVSN